MILRYKVNNIMFEQELNDAKDLIKHLSSALDHALRFNYTLINKHPDQHKSFIALIHKARKFVE